MKEHAYNPYTRASKDQILDKICPNCGSEHMFEREARHQHWRPSGTQTGELIEINGVVWIKCECGNHIRTRLKPMSASMPKSMAIERGLLEPETQKAGRDKPEFNCPQCSMVPADREQAIQRLKEIRDRIAVLHDMKESHQDGSNFHMCDDCENWTDEQNDLRCERNRIRRKFTVKEEYCPRCDTIHIEGEKCPEEGSADEWGSLDC